MASFQSLNAIVAGGTSLSTILDMHDMTLFATPHDGDPRPSQPAERFGPAAWRMLRIVLLPLAILLMAAVGAVAQVHLLSPNGGESFELGAPVMVTWTAPGVSTLQLQYSSDGGTTWQNVMGGIPAASGSTSFRPASAPTRLAMVRLVNEANQADFDRSDAPFSILAPKSLVIFLPTQDDELVAGSITSIVWYSTRITTLAIDFSSDDGATWTTLNSNVNAGFGSYAWVVPNTLTSQGRIRLREVGGDAFALSGMFSILASKNPLVRVLSPNGGEVYMVGDSIKVLWSAAYSPKLWISLSSDGGATWQYLRAGYPTELGYFLFFAPDVPSKNYKIRIESGTVTDVSDAPFEIRRPLAPAIHVLSPNGGEEYHADSVVTISWTSVDFSGENVAVEYSIDSGATWRGIASVDVGLGSVKWTVPDSVTARALVRVRRLIESTMDASDTTFQILPPPPPPPGPIRVIAPNGGEEWHVGTNQSITWSAPADVTVVKIELSVDGGFSYSTIYGAAPSTPSNGQYSWTVSNTPSQTALIRISDATDASRYDVSDANFTISIGSTVGVAEERVAGISMAATASPNPATASTQIRWHQAAHAAVAIRLFDATGALVRTIDAGVREAGEQQLPLSVSDLPSGVYRFQIVGAGMVSGVISVMR